jgi:lipoprotein-anchoring transpeptidase ErfK/SrfK
MNTKLGLSSTVKTSLAAGLAVFMSVCSLNTVGAAPLRADVLERPGYVPTPQEEMLPRELRPQRVTFPNSEAPGTIIVHTDERFLYLIETNDQAIRYAIGVGRDGFQWEGKVTITEKKEWPDWRPPQEMIERQPYLPRFMAGGEGNPLGARALYLGSTDYRIHGTNQPQTIGKAMSSGCIRMVNRDVIDLYSRISVGAPVIVRQHAPLFQQAQL